MDYIKFLSDLYSYYKTETTYGENYTTLTIFNPNGKNNIEVDYEYFDDGFKRFTFYFSYQHAHFSTTPHYTVDQAFQDLCNYIESFITDKLAALEFFINGKSRGGGHISLEDINGNLCESVAKEMLFPIENGLEYKIRCWSGKHDVNGKVSIGSNNFENNIF